MGWRTVCDSAVVCFFKVAVCGERVRDARVLRFCEFIVDWIVEALPPISFEDRPRQAVFHTGPVSVEFDLLLHVPTKSVNEACAAARPAPSSSVATEASIPQVGGDVASVDGRRSCAGLWRGRSGAMRRECSAIVVKALPRSARRQEGSSRDRDSNRDCAAASVTDRQATQHTCHLHRRLGLKMTCTRQLQSASIYL